MADHHVNQYVSLALKYGAIKKGPCESCGAADVAAHHDDYGKPLEIRWLCWSCHSSHHMKMRKQAKAPLHGNTTLEGRTQSVTVMLTVIELDLVRVAANRAGKSMSAFMRDKSIYNRGGIFDGGRKPKK